jgi:hypothetical protein
MRPATYTASVAAAVAALWLGGDVHATADTGQDWLIYQLYRSHQKWYWPFGEDYILGVAHGVCSDWDSGVGYTDEVESLATSQRWTHRNARYFIALSTRALCPVHYEPLIPPEDRIVDLPPP